MREDMAKVLVERPRKGGGVKYPRHAGREPLENRPRSEPIKSRYIRHPKWLNENLFLGYIYRMNAPEEKNLNEAQAEYRLGRRWLLEAFFGDRGVAGADIIWSKKY